MRKRLIILISSLLLIEMVAILIHQVILHYMFLPIYVLPFLFFAVSESVYAAIVGKNIQWFMIYKMTKMIFAVLLIGIYLLKASIPDLGFIVRFFAYYFVFLGVETYISTQIAREK